jgi:hypothetical protein
MKLWLALFLGAALPATAVELATSNTPWRAFLVIGPKLMAERDGNRIVDHRARNPWNGVAFEPSGTNAARFLPLFSRMPDTRWTEGDYDDAHWARYLPADLDDYLGDYGVPASGGHGGGMWPALLCLRSRFGIANPAQAKDVTVTVRCLGGAVVRVNGREIGRQFLPPGEIYALTPAQSYPIEAYACAATNPAAPSLDGAAKPAPIPLPDIPWQFWQGRPATNLMAQYERRIRTATFAVPASALVKGANVLSVEIHQSPVAGPMARGGWIHAGVRSIIVASASGAGVVAYDEAAAGTRVWSAIPEEQVFDVPAKAR